MTSENHMGFIYGGSVPNFDCLICDKVLVSSDGKKINPGRTMHKDTDVEGIFGKGIERKTAIVCPEHQAQIEDEGYYLASWWGKDGMIHGTK